MTHLGETGIESFKIAPGNAERHVRKALVRLGVLADKGNGIPYHELHAESVNAVGKLTHGGYLGSGDLPVAAPGVAAGHIVGLPAVVNDNGFHTKLFGKTALGKHGIGVNVLVEGVPAGIHGIARRVGNIGVAVAVLHPKAVGGAKRLLIAHAAAIKTHNGAV